MKPLVKLRTRPSRDGRRFVYFLDHLDEQGKRCRISLGHTDKRKAERQRAHKERELHMGVVEPASMRLSAFLQYSLWKTGDQIRESTRREYRAAMKNFIEIVGDIDFQKVSLQDGERYRQACLDKGNSPATVAKKLTEIKCIFETGVKRKQLEENPLKYIKLPKSPQKEINIYSNTALQSRYLPTGGRRAHLIVILFEERKEIQGNKEAPLPWLYPVIR